VERLRKPVMQLVAVARDDAKFPENKASMAKIVWLEM